MNKKHGECLEWYENGSLQSSTKWKSGIKHGYHVQWDKNDDYLSEEYYNYGVKTGKHEYWYRIPGEVFHHVRNYENGHLSGEQKVVDS